MNEGEIHGNVNNDSTQKHVDALELQEPTLAEVIAEAKQVIESIKLNLAREEIPFNRELIFQITRGLDAIRKIIQVRKKVESPSIEMHEDVRAINDLVQAILDLVNRISEGDGDSLALSLRKGVIKNGVETAIGEKLKNGL